GPPPRCSVSPSSSSPRPGPWWCLRLISPSAQIQSRVTVLAARSASGYDVNAPKVVASMQRFKYQAMVTPFADDDGGARSMLSSGTHRMVLRAENSETHRTEVFSALVDGGEGEALRAGSPPIMVTLWVIGDDVSAYFDIGSHFSHWSGHDLGRGVVTRRLHI